jgi:hypothetical protein
MYTKVDDDIVFIEDNAVATIVSAKLNNPELYVISANIVNQPPLSWVHHHLGVVKPYLPELDLPTDFDRSSIFKPYIDDFSNSVYRKLLSCRLGLDQWTSISQTSSSIIQMAHIRDIDATFCGKSGIMIRHRSR